MRTWRSADVVLCYDEDDPYAPAAVGIRTAALNTGGRRVTIEIGAGTQHREGAAAIYRHQENGSCDCNGCRPSRRPLSRA